MPKYLNLTKEEKIRTKKQVLEEYINRFGNRLFDYSVATLNNMISVLNEVEKVFPDDLDNLQCLIDIKDEIELLSRKQLNEYRVVLPKMVSPVACMLEPVCSPEFLIQLSLQIVPQMENAIKAEDVHDYFLGNSCIGPFVNFFRKDKYYYREIENGVHYLYFNCGFSLFIPSVLLWVRCYSPNAPDAFCDPADVYDSKSICFELSPKLPNEFDFSIEEYRRFIDQGIFIGWSDYTGEFIYDTNMQFSDYVSVNGWKKTVRRFVRSARSSKKRAEKRELSNVDYPDFPDVVFTVTFKNAVNEETLNRITKAVQKTYGKSRENAPNYDDFEIKGEKEIQIFIDFGECGIKSADKVYKAILNFSEDVEKITVEQ